MYEDNIANDFNNVVVLTVITLCLFGIFREVVGRTTPQAVTNIRIKNSKTFFISLYVIILIAIGYFFVVYQIPSLKERSVVMLWLIIIYICAIFMSCIPFIVRACRYNNSILKEKLTTSEMAKRNNRCVRRLNQPLSYDGRKYGTLKTMNALEDVMVFYPPLYLEKKDEAILHIDIDNIIREIHEFNMILSARTIVIFNENKVLRFHYDEIVRVVKESAAKMPINNLLFVLADGAEFVVRFPVCTRYDELFIFLKEANRRIEIIEV